MTKLLRAKDILAERKRNTKKWGCPYCHRLQRTIDRMNQEMSQITADCIDKILESYGVREENSDVQLSS